MENGVVMEEPRVKTMEFEYESAMAELTSFTEYVDPKTDKKFLKVWHKVEKALEKHGLYAVWFHEEGRIIVYTTAMTKDPHIIHKARGCIVLVLHFRFPTSVAYRGIDDQIYYDYIETGYQDGGLAAMHGMDKEQYIRKQKSLSKHLKDIAVMCSCGVTFNDDSMVVGAKTYGCVKRFRNIIERCYFEDLDPAKLDGLEKSKLTMMVRRMKI